LIFALIGALCVGLSLGLLGSGGSILTVPVLVYMLHQSPKIAIAGSLAIVGAIALIGAIRYAHQGLVSWRHVLLFGLPGVFGTYGGAWVSKFVPGSVQLVVFAVVMALAAWGMLKSPVKMPSDDDNQGSAEKPLFWLILAGIGVGIITGFVGVGGGFLLVPALVFLGGLPMHRGIATSLAVIVINSASGFYKQFNVITSAGHSLDWRIIGLFILVGGVGSLIGNTIARRIPQRRLRQVFGVFLILMCGFILWRTVPGLLHHNGSTHV